MTIWPQLNNVKCPLKVPCLVTCYYVSKAAFKKQEKYCGQWCKCFLLRQDSNVPTHNVQLTTPHLPTAKCKLSGSTNLKVVNLFTGALFPTITIKAAISIQMPLVPCYITERNRKVSSGFQTAKQNVLLHSASPPNELAKLKTEKIAS